MLHRGGELERVGRNDTVVVVRGSHQRRGVFHALLYIVQRRVLVNIGKLLLVLRRTVLHGPAPADGELVVAEHVHHAHGRKAHGIEVRTLHLAGADQQSAVRAAVDGQLVRRRVFSGDQVLGGGDEVVEDVLLVLEHAGLVPLLAVLRAAAQVGDAVDAALLDEHQRRGVEAGREVDLKTAVSVKQAGILAVALHVLAAGDEHRDLRAVLRGVEHLLGREQFGIEIHLRSLVERRFARSDVVFVDRGRSRVVGQRIVKFRVLLPAVESADRADGRKRHFAHLLAGVVVLVNPALRILQVVGEQAAARRAHAFEQVPFTLGNHRFDPPGTVQIDLHQRVVRRIPVGHVIKPVVLAVDGRIIGIETRQQDAEFRVRHPFIEDLHSRRTLRSYDEEPFAVLRRPCREVTQRMFPVLVNELVGRLGRTQRMVINLLKLVLGRVGVLLRGVVGAVIEPLGIGRPPCAREFHPLDLVGSERLVGGVHHADLHPVRTRRGGRIGKPAAVLREGHVGQGHRPVVGELIGVEEHLAGLARLLRAVDHRLVLQTVVISVVPPVAVLARGALLGVVPHFGQPLADGPAERNLREIVLRHGVLGGDPRGRGLRVVVLEPAVGIGNLRAEIVVHHVAAHGLGVRLVFYLFHIAATCRRRCTEQKGGFDG